MLRKIFIHSFWKRVLRLFKGGMLAQVFCGNLKLSFQCNGKFKFVNSNLCAATL